MFRKKILLAEDDPDDQVLFYEFLSHREDIHILPAVENGVELLTLLEATTEDKELPHLIVLDQNMPKMNGLQTLAILKAHDRYYRLPVVIYSTYIDDRLEQPCLELGACMVYGKPHTKEGYEKMLNAFLRFT